jgi:hypothetical protein
MEMIGDIFHGILPSKIGFPICSPTKKREFNQEAFGSKC